MASLHERIQGHARRVTAPAAALARARLGEAHAWIARELRPRLVADVRARLSPRDAAVVELRTALDVARRDAVRLEDRVAFEVARLDRSPFHAGMTVHVAHARHPGVQALFARRGLPRCPDCAVGRDETLAEAAFGEGFHVNDLLDELKALEASCR